MDQKTFIDIDPTFLKCMSPQRIFDNYFGEFIFAPSHIKYYLWFYIFSDDDLRSNISFAEYGINRWYEEKDHDEDCRLNRPYFMDIMRNLKGREAAARNYCSCDYFNIIDTYVSEHDTINRQLWHRECNSDDYEDGVYIGDPPNNPNAGKVQFGPAFDKSVDEDCATQCIGHIVKDRYDLTYDYVAKKLQSRKEADDAPVEYKTKSEIDEWMKHHKGPHIRTILDTIGDLTGTIYKRIETIYGYTLQEMAILNQHIKHMAIGSDGHITAVKYGEIFDEWDSSQKIASSVLVPMDDYDRLKGCMI